MMDLIGLLVTVVVLGLVFYIVYWILTKIPLPEPWSVVVQVIVGLVAVVILLSLLFGAFPLPRHLIGR